MDKVVHQLHGEMLLAPRQEWARKALQKAAESTGVDLSLALAAVKTRSVVEARRVLAHELRGEKYTLAEIAYILGYKDHSTIMYLLKGGRSRKKLDPPRLTTEAPAKESKPPPPEPLKFQPCTKPVPTHRTA